MGEALNLANRLMIEATADQAVATNSFYMALDAAGRGGFEAIEAKNVGRIQAWCITREALDALRPRAEATRGRSRR